MGRLAKALPLIVMLGSLLTAQTTPPTPSPTKPADDYSGMYSFLQDGEFVQLSVEDGTRVSGFISRFGDSESDHGQFLDHFFKPSKLEGRQLNFTTQTVHGIWYESKGNIERGPGKNLGDEAYYLLKGTLTQYTTDNNKETTSKSREVAFKSFPQDLDSAPEKQN